ncbi:MAG TPA: MarR family transcriptional regulator [Solirubrobacteraceae bacterium]|nr:MarR family transcriptional regulator [Solirubrobacteraceae bacterium]
MERVGASADGTDGAVPSKAEELESLVTYLPRRISYLSRILYRTDGSTLPRGMRSVVFTLAPGPMRISDIAWQEGIGQPAATRMVARLEALGLVSRERSETDGRIVIVGLTEKGREELDVLRGQSRQLIRGALDSRSAAEVRRLKTASDTLEQLIGWVLEEESHVEANVGGAQAGNGASSRRRTRRASRS